jgi:hypothetical protein
MDEKSTLSTFLCVCPTNYSSSRTATAPIGLPLRVPLWRWLALRPSKTLRPVSSHSLYCPLPPLQLSESPEEFE